MRTLLWIIIVFFVTACVTNPQKEYKEILELQSQVAVQHPFDAVGQSETTSLVKGDKLTFKLEEKNPTINLDGVVSFYQIFTLEAKKGERISITSYSPIKGTPILYIVRPRLFIMDSKGKIILDSMENESVGRAWGGMGPIQFQADWNFTAVSGGRYYILATSDNRSLGKEVASADGDAMVGALFKGLKAHSTGTMNLLWNN